MAKRKISVGFIAPKLIFKILLRTITGVYTAETRTMAKYYLFHSGNEIPNVPRELAHLHINIDRKYRRKGIGRELVRTLQDYAKKEQIEKIQCVSVKGSLVEFYKNLGFVPVKLLPYFYPKAGTLTYMEYKVSFI